MTKSRRRISIVEREPTTVDLLERDVQQLESVESIEVRRRGDGRVTLTADRYVGVIGTPSGVVLEIQPKVQCNLLYCLAYTNRLTDEIAAGSVAGHRSDESFVNLVARLLIKEVDQILKQGLHQAYVPQEATETHLRGQLNLQQQLQQHGHGATKFECRYDELSRDILINKILLDALHRLRSLVTETTLSEPLTRLVGQLKQRVSHDHINAQVVDEIQLTRLTAQYRNALRLSELVLDHTFVSSLTGGTQQIDSLLLNMERLFEEVVVRAVRDAVVADDYAVRTQSIGSLVVTQNGQTELNMYPDFTIVSRKTGGVVHIGDAKWKNGTKPSQGDLYQLATYQAKHETSGTIVYPDLEGVIANEYSFDTGRGRAAGRGDLKVIEIETINESYNEFATAVRTQIEEGLPTTVIEDETA